MRKSVAGDDAHGGEKKGCGDGEPVVREISEAAEMDGLRSPVVQPLIRLTSKTTSWASLSDNTGNRSIDDQNSDVEERCESLPPLKLFTGCDFSFQKTVVYENGLRFVRRNCGSEISPFDSIRRAHSSSGDSGLFVDMDKRSDRTNDGTFSVCSDLGMDEEPAYSVPTCARPLESVVTDDGELLAGSDSTSSESPIYMELEPPKDLEEPPRLVPMRRPPLRNKPNIISSAEKRMMMSVEKTNREVFEKPCSIRMVYRRHSQRRLLSRKRVERVVPRLTQLCVQILINQV